MITALFALLLRVLDEQHPHSLVNISWTDFGREKNTSQTSDFVWKKLNTVSRSVTCTEMSTLSIYLYLLPKWIWCLLLLQLFISNLLLKCQCLLFCKMVWNGPPYYVSSFCFKMKFINGYILRIILQVSTLSHFLSFNSLRLSDAYMD